MDNAAQASAGTAEIALFPGAPELREAGSLLALQKLEAILNPETYRRNARSQFRQAHVLQQIEKVIEAAPNPCRSLMHQAKRLLAEYIDYNKGYSDGDESWVRNLRSDGPAREKMRALYWKLDEMRHRVEEMVSPPHLADALSQDIQDGVSFEHFPALKCIAERADIHVESAGFAQELHEFYLRYGRLHQGRIHTDTYQQFIDEMRTAIAEYRTHGTPEARERYCPGIEPALHALYKQPTREGVKEVRDLLREHIKHFDDRYFNFKKNYAGRLPRAVREDMEGIVTENIACGPSKLDQHKLLQRGHVLELAYAMRWAEMINEVQCRIDDRFQIREHGKDRQ